MLLVVHPAGSLRTLRTLLWNGESKLPWKPWELPWMGWLTQTEEDWNRYKQPPPGGFPPGLLGPKANIKHGSQALMHFNVSRLQKEWGRKKRNLHRDTGEYDGDCISNSACECVALWLCAMTAFPPVSWHWDLQRGLWMHPCGNCLNLISSFEAVRVVGFPFKYAVTDDEVSPCNLLK